MKYEYTFDSFFSFFYFRDAWSCHASYVLQRRADQHTKYVKYYNTKSDILRLLPSWYLLHVFPPSTVRGGCWLPVQKLPRVYCGGLLPREHVMQIPWSLIPAPRIPSWWPITVEACRANAMIASNRAMIYGIRILCRGQPCFFRFCFPRLGGP